MDIIGRAESLHGLWIGSDSSPLHLLGLGATVFLQAALGLEADFIKQASELLSQAESAINQRRKTKSSSSLFAGKGNENAMRFPIGTEWDILQADVVVLQGMIHTLSESYYGWLIVVVCVMMY